MFALLVFLIGGMPGELAVDIPLYVVADVKAKTLKRALAEAVHVFAPGGIHLSFDVSPERRSDSPLATIVLQERPSRFVVNGCRRNRHDHRLGRTHLRARRITLWSEQIARAVSGDWDRAEIPAVDERVYARALGRVLAHELGHLLLSLDGHRASGLMRAAFSHRSLTSARDRAFRLSRGDLENIRSVLEAKLRRRAGSPHIVK